MQSVTQSKVEYSSHSKVEYSSHTAGRNKAGANLTQQGTAGTQQGAAGTQQGAAMFCYVEQLIRDGRLSQKDEVGSCGHVEKGD